ncbi:MAG: two-component sensor histidine kinase, partial [Streptomyces sp.]|nr:two-component sensor histidine kinase [Streptomyces sp.]
MTANTGNRIHSRSVRLFCAALAVLAVVGGLLAGGWAGWRSVASMTVVVLGALAVAGWRDRVHLVPVTLGVAVVSALGTVFGD